MAVIELVQEKTVTDEADRARRVGPRSRRGGSGRRQLAEEARTGARRRGRRPRGQRDQERRSTRPRPPTRPPTPPRTRSRRRPDRRGPLRRGQPRPAGRPGPGPGGLRDQGQRRLDAVPRARFGVLRPHRARGLVRDRGGRARPPGSASPPRSVRTTPPRSPDASARPHRARRRPRTAGSVLFRAGSGSGWTSPTTGPTSPAGPPSRAGAPCAGCWSRRCPRCCASRSRLTVAGRTDAGVHATGQVAHADLAVDLDPSWLVRRLARLLPPDVRVRAVSPVPPGVRRPLRRAAPALPLPHRHRRARRPSRCAPGTP